MPRTAHSEATSPAFMSHAPRPVYFVACDSSAERVCSLPGEQVTGWHDVDVRIKHQRRPDPPARNAADHSPCLRAIDLDTWKVWLRERLLERDPPGVDVEVHGDHAIGQQALDFNLIVRARHARHSNKAREIGDDLSRVLVDIVKQPGPPGVMVWKGGGSQLSYHLSDGDGAPLSEQIEQIPAVMSPHPRREDRDPSYVNGARLRVVDRLSSSVETSANANLVPLNVASTGFDEPSRWSAQSLTG